MVHEKRTICIVVSTRIGGKIIISDSFRNKMTVFIADGNSRTGRNGTGDLFEAFRMDPVSKGDFPLMNERSPGPETLPLLFQRKNNTVILPGMKILSGNMSPAMSPFAELAAVMPPVKKVKKMKYSIEKTERYIADPSIQSFRTPQMHRLFPDVRF